MSLYLLLSHDDPSCAATLLLQSGPTIDDLVGALKDLGGECHALVATAGNYGLAGLVSIPDSASAVAFRLMNATRGHHLQLIPAVSVTEFETVVDRAQTITVAYATDDSAATRES